MQLITGRVIIITITVTVTVAVVGVIVNNTQVVKIIQGWGVKITVENTVNWSGACLIRYK